MLVCVKCGSFLKPVKNGVAVEEMMPGSTAHLWVPYKIWMADLVGCERCGAEVAVIGHSQQPIAEHYQPTYLRAAETYRPIVQVKDCPGTYSNARAEEYRVRRNAEVPRVSG